MLNKLLLALSMIAISSTVFASEEVIFKCDTKPDGLIKVTKKNSLYDINIVKNGKEILNFSKDYKKNTSKNFIKFNYSQGMDYIATGLEFGYLGKKNSLHSILVDEYTTHSIAYSIDNNNILECIKNENYINHFKEIDKNKSLPAFYYD